MRNGLKVALTAALLVAGSAAARADLLVVNSSGKPVWVTIYDALGQGLNSYCATDGTTTKLVGSAYARAVIVYVRGEQKSNTSCGGKTVSDTGRGPPVSIGGATAKAFVTYSGKLHVQ